MEVNLTGFNQGQDSDLHTMLLDTSGSSKTEYPALDGVQKQNNEQDRLRASRENATTEEKMKSFIDNAKKNNLIASAFNKVKELTTDYTDEEGFETTDDGIEMVLQNNKLVAHLLNLLQQTSRHHSQFLQHQLQTQHPSLQGPLANILTNPSLNHRSAQYS